MVIFLCSPHERGVTDRLGEAAAAGARAGGVRAQIITLCRCFIAGCLGCGECHAHNGKCALPIDDANGLFDVMERSRALIFASPIYFYALPAQFKAFIDRSQKFWAALDGGAPRFQPAKKAAVIMAAGRAQGERLFEGSLLTLKWFLKPFGYEIAFRLLFRGLDSLPDVEARHDLAAFELGKAMALCR